MCAIAAAKVRQSIVDAIRLDLIGPDNRHAFTRELLSKLPSRWYMAGYLIPTDALPMLIVRVIAKYVGCGMSPMGEVLDTERENRRMHHG